MQGFDCPVGCGGLWTTREHRDEHIRRCHPERKPAQPPVNDLPLFADRKE